MANYSSINDINHMSKKKGLKIMSHINMTVSSRSSELLVHQHTPLTYKKSFFSYFCLFQSQVKQERWWQSWQMLLRHSPRKPGRGSLQWKQHLKILQHYTQTHPWCFSLHYWKVIYQPLISHVGSLCVFTATKKNSQAAKWLKCATSSVTFRDNTLNSQRSLI